MRRVMTLFAGDGSEHNSSDVLRLIIRGMIILLAAFVITVFVPGLIAAKDKVFYDIDVRAKLPDTASRSLSGYEDQKRRLSESVTSLRKDLDSLNDASQQRDFDFYVHLLEERQNELTAVRPSIFVFGYFLSPQMLLWPAIYASLGCLIFCFEGSSRRYPTWATKLQVLSLGIFIYIYYEWPLWVRNFLLGTHSRTVYAYSNYDIDRSSFFVQEVMIAGFALLVATVWLRWLGFSIDQEDTAGVESSGNYLSLELVSTIQRAFYRWIVGSFILGLGFIYFTTFFWSLVASYHDQRYILSAFLAHSLWILTWVFISMPLVKSWIRLKARRLNAIQELMKMSQSTPGKSEQINLEGLEKLESLAGVRISIAGIGAGISLVLPILQLFFHKS